MPPVNRIITLPDSPAVRALGKDKAFENAFLPKLQTKCTVYRVPLKKSDIEYAESLAKMLNSVSDCPKEDQIKILQLMGDRKFTKEK